MKKTNWKYLAAGLLVIVLTVMLCACGGKKTAAPAENPANAEEPAAKSAEVPESLQQRIKTITEGGF